LSKLAAPVSIDPVHEFVRLLERILMVLRAIKTRGAPVVGLAVVLGGYLIFLGFEAAGRAGVLEAQFSRELYHAIRMDCDSGRAGSLRPKRLNDWPALEKADGAP
jgi:hypothetical protein